MSSKDLERDNLAFECSKGVGEIAAIIDLNRDMKSRLSNLKTPSDLGYFQSPVPFDFDQHDRINRDILQRNKIEFEKLNKQLDEKVQFNKNSMDKEIFIFL